ncbi:hypothetical protein J1605_011029 [Eschrichtius robustus]|uniref:Gasdermin pore forming domain-containing protein n=1 Tax=Eschrichtius robustus TaxID=9764 RepID=A0AB34GSV2_ESCRO|nr:hypothetical protein J1605_011029 [Eschrichtius robustus]
MEGFPEEVSMGQMVKRKKEPGPGWKPKSGTGMHRQGSINHKEAVTIPKGCVLAFRVRQLVVKGRDEWDIPHICNDNMQTLPPREEPEEEKLTFIQASDVGEVHKDFRTLKEEFQRETREVEKLSPEGKSSRSAPSANS